MALHFVSEVVLADEVMWTMRERQWLASNWEMEVSLVLPENYGKEQDCIGKSGPQVAVKVSWTL